MREVNVSLKWISKKLLGNLNLTLQHNYIPWIYENEVLNLDSVILPRTHFHNNDFNLHLWKKDEVNKKPKSKTLLAWISLSIKKLNIKKRNIFYQGQVSSIFIPFGLGLTATSGITVCEQPCVSTEENFFTKILRVASSSFIYSSQTAQSVMLQ